MRRIHGRWAALAAVVAGFALAACGDGGGGDTGVTYTGVTSQAAVTDSNAAEIATSAYQGGNSAGSFALVGIASEPASGVGGAAARGAMVSRVLKDAVKSARFSHHGSTDLAAGAVRSASGELDPGNCGGAASFSGTVNDVTGEFQANFNFAGWCNDGVTVAGRVTASGQVDVSTEELTDLQFSFTVLTVSDGTDTLRATGSIGVSFGDSDVLTINMDYAAGDGTTFRASNLAITASEAIGGESFLVTGRVYHPVHGYVDVSTPQPLVVQTGQEFPSSGELVATGANDSKARLTALSATQFQIEVDVDGDDVYETDLGTFPWGGGA